MRPGSPSRPQQKSLLSCRGCSRRPAEHVQPAPIMFNALCVFHTPCLVCRASYLLQRRDGLAAVYSRKTKGLTVRIYQFQCHVVKQYTGDTSKVGGTGEKGSVLCWPACMAAASHKAVSTQPPRFGRVCHSERPEPLMLLSPQGALPSPAQPDGCRCCAPALLTQPPKLLLQLATELSVLQQLHHDSLTSYLFIVNEGARVSVVMDWAGQGLRSLVKQQQPLGEDAARYVAFQLADSLAHLHSKVNTSLHRGLLGSTQRHIGSVCGVPQPADGLQDVGELPGHDPANIAAFPCLRASCAALHAGHRAQGHQARQHRCAA